MDDGGVGSGDDGGDGDDDGGDSQRLGWTDEHCPMSIEQSALIIGWHGDDGDGDDDDDCDDDDDDDNDDGSQR